MSPAAREQPLGGGGEHVGARVANLVDAVAESHQPLAAFDLPAQQRFGARGVADLEHHVERRAGRAAVQRPLQRADRADDRRDEVGAGGRDHAAGEGRRVEAVIDDRVQIGLERAHALRRRARRRSACRESSRHGPGRRGARSARARDAAAQKAATIVGIRATIAVGLSSRRARSCRRRCAARPSGRRGPRAHSRSSASVAGGSSRCGRELRRESASSCGGGRQLAVPEQPGRFLERRRSPPARRPESPR